MLYIYICISPAARFLHITGSSSHVQVSVGWIVGRRCEIHSLAHRSLRVTTIRTSCPTVPPHWTIVAILDYRPISTGA